MPLAMALTPRRESLHQSRGYVRRSIELACELVTKTCDAPELSWGVDLSESGILLEATQPLVLGDGVVVCLQPASGWQLPELMLFGEIARSVNGRRRGDSASGVAVRFLDLGAAERRALARWLRPRPRATTKLRSHGSAGRTVSGPRASAHPFASLIG
ncbi:MAG: hypothetical protein EXR75_13205 [Myxococcales bacterium]|nr:hypothetical protein [Myxococcales bacterium]